MIHTCVCIVNVYTQTARRYIEINMATNLSSGVVLSETKESISHCSETISQSVYEKREGTRVVRMYVVYVCVHSNVCSTRYSWYLCTKYTCTTAVLPVQNIR
jgi:hypothetical protein